MNNAAFVNRYYMLLNAVVITIAITLIYMQDLAMIFKNAIIFSSANLTNYILIIPFLIAYIIYRKRNILVSLALPRTKAIRLDDIIGLTLIFIAMLLYIYGSLTLYALEYHIYSIPIAVAGLTALLFNLKILRHSLFAIFILAYLQPPPAELLAAIAGDLAWISATLAESMLKFYGLQVNLNADYGAPALIISKDNIQTPFFVGEPSSGLFSTIGLSLFALIAAYIARGAIWKRAIMYIIGFPLFFLLNALRISIIIALWYHFGEQTSEAFHAMSGSIMAIPGTLAILIIGERLLRIKIGILTASKNNECKYCASSNKLNEQTCLSCHRIFHIRRIDAKEMTRFLFIALIILSMMIVNTLQVQADPVNKNRLLTFDMNDINGKEKETVGLFLPEIEGYKLEYAYRDQRVEKVLRQDAALAYRYVKQNDTLSEGSFLKPSIYVSIQIATGKHKWEDSLLVYPSRVGRPTAEVLELKDVKIDEENTARFFVYVRPNQKNTEAVLYWFERVPFRFGDQYENRNVHIILWSYLNTLARNGFIKDENDIQGAEKFYLSIAKHIKEYWNQINEGLVTTKTVKNTVNNFPILMGISLIPSSLLFLKEFMRTNVGKNTAKRLYSTLTDESKMLIDVITNLSKEGYATLDAIEREYSKLTGKSIALEELIQMLINARDAGLIKSILINIDDKPLVGWKSNLN